MKKIILAASAVVISFHAFASESETTLLADAYPAFRYQSAPGLGVGYGIKQDAKQFNGGVSESAYLNECVTGDVKDSVVNVKTEPFTGPTVVTSGSRVKVILTAQTSNRRVLSFGSKTEIKKYPKSRFKDLCGEQYISEAHIGKRIAIIKSFVTEKAEDQTRLAEILRARVSDLQTLLSLDLSKDNFKLIGVGFETRGDVSAELDHKMNQCFWYGKACDQFVAQAYADAAELDKVYPAERVANLRDNVEPYDGGDFLLYKFKSYNK